MAGLLSGIVGGIVIGALSGSSLSVSGPAAGLTTIVLGGIEGLNSFPKFLAAVFLAGLLQLLLGKLRAGTLNRLFPSPVIKGMLAAIGLILILKQTPHLVGYDAEAFGVEDFSDTDREVDPNYPGGSPVWSNTFSIFWYAFRHVEPGACIIGILAFLLLILWDKKVAKKFPMVPGSLVAVGAGVVINQVFKYVAPALEVASSHKVNIPKIADGVLTMTDWSALSDPMTWRLAVTIGLVASIETLLCLEAIERLDPLSRGSRPNQELFAQGVGNCLCGLIGGIPVTSVIVRSSVNLAAGAQSRASAIAHGVYLLLALLLFSPLMNEVPLSVLAAVLVHVGLKMASPQIFFELRKKGLTQWVPFAATVIAVMLTDLLIGIGFGLAVAALFILRNMYQSWGFDVEKHGKVTRIIFHQEVTFFHKARLSKVLDEVPPFSIVELDGSPARSVDHDVLDVIHQFRKHALNNNIQVIVGGIPLVESYTPEQMRSIEAEYQRLIANNREWAKEKVQEDPEFFTKQPEIPKFLFIGCSDSRVPAETITKTELGTLYVHRNVGNLVSLHDVNLMSVVQYSVEILNVPHIIVCGHYGCGGVRAAMNKRSYGLIDNWVHPIKMTYKKHEKELEEIADPNQRERRMIELHVLQQARNLLKVATVQRSISMIGTPHVHAWVYDVETGLINDLNAELTVEKDIAAVYQYDS